MTQAAPRRAGTAPDGGYRVRKGSPSARPAHRGLAAAVLLLLLASGAGCGPGAPGAAVRCAADDGPCVAVGPGGLRVSLEISPRPVRTLRDLRFAVEARLAGAALADSSVAVELRMPGMAMGTNRVVLSRRADGRYEGVGVIVRCPSGGRAWEATVVSRSIAGVRFAFEVDRP